MDAFWWLNLKKLKFFNYIHTIKIEFDRVSLGIEVAFLYSLSSNYITCLFKKKTNDITLFIWEKHYVKLILFL